MASVSPEVLKAIDPALRQVRRALRELEQSELPTPLRKVAASEGGRLPPPLLASLLDELDRNEWLRGRLAEKLGDRIEPGTEAFLTRGDGWWLAVAELAASASRSRPPQPAGDAAAELEKRLAATREKLEAASRERDRLKAAVKEGREARARLVDPAAVAAELDALRAELRSSDQLLAAERAGRVAAEERVDDLLRRSRSAAPASEPVAARPRSVGMGDPVEVARRLDTEVAALAAGVAPAEPVGATPPTAPSPELAPSLRLAPGMAPDRPEAVAWLLGHTDPALVVVDGYNVTFLLDRDDFHGPTARRRLVGLLGRLASRKPHRFVVVFDSDQPRGSARWAGDVEVAFTSGEKADDAIVEMAEGSTLPVVVVTNDRELRERAEAVGALALWGDALVPLLRGDATGPARPEP